MTARASERLSAILDREAACRTVWLIMQDGRPRCYATTYPDSDLVYLETLSGRQIAPGQATRLLQEVRAALSEAGRDDRRAQPPR